MYTKPSNTFDGIVRDADTAFIPNDPDNVDWAAYQEWLAAGNTASDAPTPPVVVPNVVTRLQGRLALFNAGLLEQVEAAVAAAGGAAAIWYADAQNWVRNDPTFVALATQIHEVGNMTQTLTDADLDALFLAASKI